LALLLGCWLSRQWNERRSFRRESILFLVFGVVLAVLLELLPRWMASHTNLVMAATQLGWRWHVLAFTLLLAGVLPFIFSRTHHARAAIVSMLLGAAILVGSFDLSFSRLDVGRSVKDLALALKLQPGDEIMTYEDYYQDLPVYLERRVTIVNWTGELEFGTKAEDTRAWMIDLTEFRARWRTPHTIYLFTSKGNYAKLQAEPPGPMCQVQSNIRVVVVVNRECPA